MKTYIVQLETHDDIISAQDKISWTKARRVLLVWPRRGRLFERQVDLLLLLRHAQTLGAQIAIVTKSSTVKTNAQDLGIAVFKNPAQAQKSNWLRLHTRRKLLFCPRAPLDPNVLRQQRMAFQIRSQQSIWLRSIAFVTGVLAFIILVLFFVPAASLEVKPLQKTQSLAIPVWASPEMNVTNPSGGFPALVIQVEVEGRSQTPSSGQAFIPDESAVGQVTLTNLTDRTLVVPAESIVATIREPVVRYVTLASVDLPAEAGAQVTVDVRAVTPGQIGNVPAGMIQTMEGPDGMFVAVTNPGPTRQGSDRRVPAPTLTDERRLREKLLTELQQMAMEELRERLQPGQLLLENSLQMEQIVAENREPASNTPADMLQLTMRVAFHAWVIEEKDLQTVAQAALDATLEKDFHAVPGSLTYAFNGEMALDKEAPGSDVIVARGELAMERRITAAVPRSLAANVVRGQTVTSAEKTLQSIAPLAQPPVVQVFPSWWPRLPYLPFRITVISQ